MQLRIFNGSPRYKKSNSGILIRHFQDGYSSVFKEPIPVHYLANTKAMDENVSLFCITETVILIFPLYTDCMPAVVMAFLEKIHAQPNIKTRKLGFVVQSGFPESIHSTFVEKYLAKYTKRIGCEYLGTVIKGGVEGIQDMPPMMTKKLFRQMYDLGKYFAETESFHPGIRQVMAKPYKMPVAKRIFFRFLNLVGLLNFYWDTHLKKNNAYEKRFDKPYLQP